MAVLVEVHGAAELDAALGAARAMDSDWRLHSVANFGERESGTQSWRDRNPSARILAR